MPQKEKIKPVDQRNAGLPPVPGTMLALKKEQEPQRESLASPPRVCEDQRAVGKRREESLAPVAVASDSRELSGRARTQFQPGHSGNPGGKSKELEAVKRLARSLGSRAIERLGEWMESKNSKASVAACIALLDRGFGKPTQMLGSDPSNPFHIGITAELSVALRVLAAAMSKQRFTG